MALLVVVLVLLVLIAATFALSYDGVRAIALSSGVPASMARFYPGVLDAALIIAAAAGLLLRDGTWWARWYAWFAVIAIIAVAGSADALHAMNVVLPRRQAEGIVAAAPWVLVLLAFSLWITILRRPRACEDAPAEPAEPAVPLGSPAVSVLPVHTVPVLSAPVPAGRWDVDEHDDDAAGLRRVRSTPVPPGDDEDPDL